MSEFDELEKIQEKAEVLAGDTRPFKPSDIEGVKEFIILNYESLMKV